MAMTDSTSYMFDLYVPGCQKRCNYGDYSAARQGGHVIPIYYDNRNSGSRYRLWFGVTGQFSQQTLTVHVDGIAT